MGNNQGRLIQLLNDICHGKCLAGSGDTNKSLELVALLKSPHQFFNRLGLVACGLIL